MKKLFAIFLILLFSINCYAAGRSSGFGSRSYSSSSSSGFKFGSSSRSSSSSSGFRFGSSSRSSSSSSGFRFGSSAKSSTSNSLKLYEIFKQKNTPPPRDVTSSDLNKIFNNDYRQSRRDTYYQPYKAPRSRQIIIQDRPNYGIWDALLLWSILDNAGDRNMYYHHRNDAEFKEWRNDAEELCDNGDRKVCQQLKSLDKDVNVLIAKGVKADAGYITEGVDPNIYISNKVKLNELSELTICTGAKDSIYSKFSTELAKVTGLKIRNIESKGSIDNLYKLAAGECNMAWTQSDATNASKEIQSILRLKTKEDVMLICNRESGVKNLRDLNKNIKLYIGSDQTGSLYTYNNLKGVIKELAIPTLINTKPAIDSSLTASFEKDSCFFTVTPYTSNKIKILNENDKSWFIPIEAKMPGYEVVGLEWTNYRKLLQSDHNGIFDGGTNSLAVYPTLVTTQSWINQNTVVYHDVLGPNIKTLTEIVQ